MLGLSLKFNPCLVISRKFRYCAPKTRAFTTHALLSQNYNESENSHLLQNPNTRNACDTPELKDPPSSNRWGYFRNLPHISDKRVPKPWFLSVSKPADLG